VLSILIPNGPSQDILGSCGSPRRKTFSAKHQEFYKGWADGVFYSCDYAGQSATYNVHTIKEFLENKEFELVNQERAFSKVFAGNGFVDESTKVFVHRITCNGKKTVDRKVLYPFITVDGSNKAFYVYEGAIITLKFDD
jgi:hypothetical protein